MNDPTKLPWMSAIIHRSRGFTCSASIISDRHILTAAHCFQGFRIVAEEYGVMVGIVDHEMEANTSTTRIRAKRVFEYANNYMDGDIALIELEEALNFSATVQPICLSANDQPAFNKLATIAGWGAFNFTSIDSHLRFGEMRVLANQSACSNDTIFDEKRDLCLSSFDFAGHRPRVCYGDSGGPLIAKMATNHRHWTQIGVFSRFITWERCGPLDIFTRVSHYCDWIGNVTEGVVKCGGKR